MSETHTLTTHDIQSLLNTPNQWDSVDRIIQMTFKSLCDLLAVQTLKIDKLEKSLNYYSQISQTSISEISTSLDLKVSFTEIQQFLDKKVSKTDLSYLLSNKPNFQDLKNIEMRYAKIDDLNSMYEDMLKRWEDTLSKVELQDIYKLLDSKANKSDVDDALQNKANKQAVATALHKKINRGELENLIASKADLKEFQLISAAIEAKVEYTSFENFRKELFEKFEELEHWKESLGLITIQKNIENIAKESEKYQLEINNELEKVRVYSKNYIDKFKETIENKQSEFILNYSLETEEKYNSEILGCKNLIKQKTEGLEIEITKVSKNLEKLSKLLENENKSTKESISSLVTSLKESNKENQKIASTNTSSLSDIFKLQQDVQKLQKFNEEFNKKKANLAQVQEMNELSKEECLLTTRQEIHQAFVSFKAALTEDTSSIREEIKQFLSKQEQNTSLLLDKKLNISDLNNLSFEINNLKKIVSGMASQDEIDLVRDSLETLQLSFKKKTDSDHSEKKKVSECLESILKELSCKVTNNELEGILESKAGIDETNKSIGELYSQIEKRLCIDEFEVHVAGQNIINEAICAENRIARWIWKSGDINSGSIVWDAQAVNTSQDIFIWDKGKVTIQVLQPGLYQIEFGFFAKKKPTVGIVVNGETVIIGGNSLSAKPWGKQITSGITLVDFLVLPNRSRICIAYSGEPAEGFFGIKKL